MTAEDDTALSQLKRGLRDGAALAKAIFLFVLLYALFVYALLEVVPLVS